MWARFNQIKVMALCLALLAALAPTLSGCNQTCNVAMGPPPNIVLTVENGVIYGVYARFFAMRASDGKMLWQNSENPYDTSGHLPVSQMSYWNSPVAPVIDGQMVIETMGAGLLAALRATDGKMLWRSQPLPGLPPPADSPFSHPPVVADGVIYDAVGYGTIAAWNENDGHTLWVSQVVPNAEAAPSVTDPAFRDRLPRLVMAGSIVYVSIGRSVYALHTLDGSVLWRLPDAPVGTSYSAPLVAANTVYVADSNGVALALDANTGVIRWRSSAHSTLVTPSPSSVVVNGRTVYVASQESLARALNATTGTPLWRYVTHTAGGYFGGPLAPLVVVGGRIYLASLSWGLFVLDAATGRELWRATLDKRIFNSADSQPDFSVPVVDQGTVVMASANGAEAWDASNGQQLWVALVPNKVDSALVQSAAVTAGIVYLAQRGTEGTCGSSGIPPHALALRETDGAKLWQVSI